MRDSLALAPLVLLLAILGPSCYIVKFLPHFHGKTCPVQEEQMECNYSTGMIYWIPRDMRWVCGIAAPSASAFAESS